MKWVNTHRGQREDGYYLSRWSLVSEGITIARLVHTYDDRIAVYRTVGADGLGQGEGEGIPIEEKQWILDNPEEWWMTSAL